MAEQSEWRGHPYPDAEYRKPITSSCDVLQEELGFYGDGPSFRGGLLAINRIYEQTRIMKSCTHYSRLAVAAAVGQRVDNITPSTAADFLAGETLAVHAMTKPLDLYYRRFLWSQNLFPVLDEEPDVALLEKIAEEITEFRTTTWSAVLDTQSPQHQELLMETAMRVYDDIPLARNQEQDFMAGYLYAGNLMASLFAD